MPILTLLPNFGGFHRTLQRVRLANRGRLLLRTPGPVPFRTCICSYVETILSWTRHIYGPFEFRTSLGTSILLYMKNTFLDIKKSIFKKSIFTIKESIFWYQEIYFLYISRNQFHFLISKLIFISKNQSHFLISKNRFFDIKKWILISSINRIDFLITKKKMNFWYTEIDFFDIK